VLLSLHTSPVWMQNEAPSLHTPPWHSFEQHWSLPEHGLPAVWHAVVSAWQAPPAQLPLQHAAESVQAWLSAVHVPAPHRPALHAIEQHSVENVQASPVVVHLLMEATQLWLAGSQSPEQQSCPLAQVWLNGLQKTVGAVSAPPVEIGVKLSRPAILPSPLPDG